MAAGAIVATRSGALRGARRGDGAVFMGIPYAPPPCGPLRWRAPQPVEAWRGTRDALAFGADFPQPVANARSRAPRQDEDALYLNVWTPTLDAGAKLPVIVWLHGGGFQLGSGSDRGCDGTKLADEGAVVVTFNYRIGLAGFLAHPGLSRESPQGVSGNYGLLDSVAAFEWVREHIEAFGGDSGRVTAMGTSAGAASIALLLTAPLARGLFHRAILHSPGSGRPLATLETAEQAGLALGRDIDALRALSAHELLSRTAQIAPLVRSLTQPRVLRPIHDGWLLPEDEVAALRSGRFEAMPLIVGNVADEGSWLTRQWPVATRENWRALLQRDFGAAAEEIEARYPADVHTALAALFADTQFNYGARLLARSMAAREPRTWKFVFTRRAPGARDGPHHSGDTGHAFGTLEHADPIDEELSRVMRRAWVSFAATGDPQVAGWERYRAQDDNHLVFGDVIEPGARWRREQLDLLEALPRHPRERGDPGLS